MTVDKNTWSICSRSITHSCRKWREQSKGGRGGGGVGGGKQEDNPSGSAVCGWTWVSAAGTAALSLSYSVYLSLLLVCPQLTHWLDCWPVHSAAGVANWAILTGCAVWFGHLFCIDTLSKLFPAVSVLHPIHLRQFCELLFMHLPGVYTVNCDERV